MNPKNRETNDRGRVQVRYLEIDAEAGSSALMETMRSVTAALSRGGAKPVNGHSQARILTSTTPTKPSAPKNEEMFQEFVEAEASAEENVDVTAAEPATEGSEQKPKRKPHYPNCKLLTLELGRGSPNLRDFYAQKAPKTVTEKYMVVALWMKNELKLDKLELDHFFTGLTHVKVKPPKDVGQPLRDMKNKWFIQNDDSSWSLHSNGVTEIEQLPRS